MVDDSRHDIKVLRCVACGDRIYAGHPKRWGALVCCRCGDDLDEANELSLCSGCLKVLGIPARSLKKRTHGEDHLSVRRNVH
jgi:predicted amidophosphoribosyltransferase